MTSSAEARRAELGRLRRLARLLDASVRVPGTRFFVGLDSLLGLVPVAGDWATALASLYIVHRASLLGARKRTLARMLRTVAIDAAAGSIPLVGDLFDAGYRANQRIVSMLEEDLVREDPAAVRGESLAGARRPEGTEAALPIRGRGGARTTEAPRGETEEVRDRVVERQREADAQRHASAPSRRPGRRR